MTDQNQITNQSEATPATAPTFPITFVYFLSQIGQEASLAAGGTGQREQRAEGRIGLEQYRRDLKPLGWTLDADGRPVNSLSTPVVRLERGAALKSDEISLAGAESYLALNEERFADLRYDAPQEFDDLYTDYLSIGPLQKLILARIAEGRAQRRAGQEAAQAEAKRIERAQKDARMAAIITRFRADGSLRGELYSDSVLLTDPSGKVAYDDRNVDKRTPGYAEFRAEVEARNKADEERKAVEDAAREQAQAAQIAAWIAKRGDTNQRARLAEGLLPREEVLALMEAEAFFVLGDEFRRFEKITRKEVRATCSDRCCCNDEYASENCGVDFTVEDGLPTLTAAQFDILAALRKALPETAVVTPRMHRGYCDDSDCKKPHGIVRRLGFYVRQPVGSFTFKREYSAE